MFLGSENAIMLPGRLHLVTRSQKFKMAAAKPEVHVFQLLYKTAKKFILFSGSGKLNDALKSLDVETKVTHDYQMLYSVFKIACTINSLMNCDHLEVLTSGFEMESS
jgi:hypothetical protein